MRDWTIEIPSLPTLVSDIYNPNPMGIFSFFCNQMNKNLLKTIAQADYGNEANLHFEKLEKIVELCDVHEQLDWEPREVLELTRWSEPENPKWQPGEVGIQGHLIRGFACATLMYASTKFENSIPTDGQNQTLVQLIDSVVRLHEEFPQGDLYGALAGYLSWRIPLFTDEDEVERLFFSLGLFLVALFDPQRRCNGPVLDLLAQYVMDLREAILQGPYFRWYKENAPLLSLTLFKSKHDKWRALAINGMQRELSSKARALLEEVMRSA